MRVDPNQSVYPQSYRVPGHSTVVGQSGMPIRLHIATEMAKALLTNPGGITRRSEVLDEAFGFADAMITRYNSDQK